MPHLHNDILQLSMAYGLGAAILFLYCIFTYYKENPTTSKKYIIFCLLAVSMFDSLTYNAEALIAFMAILAINLTLQGREKNNE